MIARLLEHVRLPLFRNGYSLVLSSFMTSGLGIGYWILAARLYDTETVGLNSAALSAMMFLSNIALLNMVNAMNRFLPAAGPRTGRMVGVAYRIAVVMGVVVALVFLAGVQWWSPKLAFLGSSPAFAAAFVMATVAWGIFSLQDSVLTGIRQAVWVPVENTLFSIAKIVLLVLFAALLPAYGILASWMLPVLAALVMVNLLLFRRLLPLHAEQVSRVETVEPRQVVHYVAGDYVASLFWMSGAYLQPLIVTQMAGAEANAYFYLAWQIAYSLYLVSGNMGMSLIAEAAADPLKLNSYSFQVLKQTSLLLLPVIAVLVVGAPWILRLFGPEYAAEGSSLLRLLALSAVPQILVSLAISTARAQRKMNVLIATQAILSILTLSLVLLFLPRYGITGIGYAWLIGQTVVAAGLAVTRLRVILFSYVNLNLPLRVLHAAQRAAGWWSDRGKVRRAGELVERIRAARPNAALQANWVAQRRINSTQELTIVTLGPPGQPPEAVLKVALSPKVRASLVAQNHNLALLRADPRLEGWNRMLPGLLAEGEVDNRFYVIETALPGADGRRLLHDARRRERMIRAAAETIGELHRRTVSPVAVTPDLLRRWVDDRLRVLHHIDSGKSLLQPFHPGFQKLAEDLRGALEGRTLPVSWIHGDFSPGNILLAPGGETVTGIVDWDQAVEDLPMLDLVQLLLSIRILRRKCELGDVIRALLEGEDQWSPAERDLLEAAQSRLPGDRLDERSLLLLAWLRHISSNLTKSSQYAHHWLWVTKNVEVVLSSLS